MRMTFAQQFVEGKASGMIETGFQQTHDHALMVGHITSRSVMVSSTIATDPAIDHLRDLLVSVGQDILIAVAGVMVVAAGIFMVIGMKREGFKRFTDQIQGLAVGIIGPAVIAGIAMFFVTIAKNITF